MSDHQHPQSDPDWLDEFEDMANDRLGEGSACEQVHPIIDKWYTKLLEGEPPTSRDSVVQAMSCLATEILYDSPEDLVNAVLEKVSEDEVAAFIEYVLLVGRAFEISLRNGELDDL
jgi:hypothetical protein